MKILVLHNRYREPGGEDLVVLSETRMLRAHGVEVLEVVVDNEASTLRLAWPAAWSRESYANIRRACESYRPDIAHVHNFWMKLSPSVHGACHDAGVATVQTLHNFRLLCINPYFMRNGELCEDCLGKLPWRGVVRRCYRESFAASAVLANMIAWNRRRGTWDSEVDAFIALSEHGRSKFIAGNLPADRIFVKPNFVEDGIDPGTGFTPASASNVVLYAGRLSEEKGVSTLLSAWGHAQLGAFGRLVIAGDGPVRASLQSQAAALGISSTVDFAGRRDPDEIAKLIETSRLIVAPSICFETFGRTVVEAFSRARPVVVSDLGALGEIVAQGRTGLKVPVANKAALGEALKTLLTNSELADRLGENARAEYLAKYTPELNYQMLRNIYEFAMNRRKMYASQPS